MLIYCQLDPKEVISIKYYFKFKSFHSRICIWKCCHQNVKWFCLSPNVLAKGITTYWWLLMQKRCYSNALAMELRLLCTKLSIQWFCFRCLKCKNKPLCVVFCSAEYGSAVCDRCCEILTGLVFVHILLVSHFGNKKYYPLWTEVSCCP